MPVCFVVVGSDGAEDEERTPAIFDAPLQLLWLICKKYIRRWLTYRLRNNGNQRFILQLPKQLKFSSRRLQSSVAGKILQKGFIESGL
jgi:hypothetical protein